MTAALYGQLPELAAPQSLRTEPVEEQQVAEEYEPSFAEKTGSELANLKSGSFAEIDAAMRSGASAGFLNDFSVSARAEGILADGFKFHDVQFFDSQPGSFAKDFAPKSTSLVDSSTAGLRSLPSVELVT